MTVRTRAQAYYWRNVGSKRWEPMRYVTEAGRPVNVKYNGELKQAACDTMAVLARFVKRLPENTK